MVANLRFLPNARLTEKANMRKMADNSMENSKQLTEARSVDKTDVTSDKAAVPRLWMTIVRRPEWVLAVLITLAAVSFHLAFLGRAGALWRDEVNTLNVAERHSLRDMSQDSFPILMPLIVRGWLALGLGETDTGLRTLGTFIGVSLLAALWLTA